MKKLLVISLESHTVFSGNAADSELACILSVSVHFFFSKSGGFARDGMREREKREEWKAERWVLGTSVSRNLRWRLRKI
jgi:hypothetical protein